MRHVFHGFRKVAADTTASASSGGLEEVVVMAQRRAESVQNVPLSITALSEQALENRAAVDFIDYASQVPGLAFGYTGDGTATSRTISIRGISGDGTTGFYLDETPVPDSIDPRVIDLQRIEVLRGPQGTLYGARSMGGTVRLISEDPQLNDFSAWTKVNGSHTQNAGSQNYGLDAVMNLPLVADHMALRLVAFGQHDGGWFKRSFLTNPAEVNQLPPDSNPTTLGNLPTTTVDDVGRDVSFGGGATLLISLTDDLTITPRLLYQNSQQNGLPYTDDGAYPVPTPAVPPPVDMHPGSFTQYRYFDLPEFSDDRYTLASLTVKWNTGSGALSSSTSYFDRTVDEREDETDFLWQTSSHPSMGFRCQAAVRTTRCRSPRLSRNTRWSTSSWRRCASFQLSGPFQFTTGVFYQDLRGRLPYAGYYPPALAVGLSQSPGGGINGILPLNPAIPDEIFGQDAETKQREAGMVRRGVLQLHRRLEGDARRARLQYPLEPFRLSRGSRVRRPPTHRSRGVGHGQWRQPEGRGRLPFDPDKMVYALIARGYRPGGLVPSIPGNAPIDPFGCFHQLESLGYTSAAQTKSYRPDYLWDYEIGAKTEWLDHRLTVNGSDDYVDWKNIQQLVALSCGFQFRANAGAANIKNGFDLEVGAQPVRNVNLSAGVGYQPARITQTSPAVPQLVVGSQVYQVPDWTGTASATWTLPLTSGSSVVSTIGWSYTDSSTSANVTPATPRVTTLVLTARRARCV